MKERPILFSASMVRALLDGSKTQTRRVAKTEITMGRDSILAPHRGRKHAPAFLLPEHAADAVICCPYGQPGDRLWVREAFDFLPCGGPDEPQACEIVYWATGSHEPRMVPVDYNPLIYSREKVRPSIHMPRWASRITLEITGVRVERLQDISDANAQTEGADCLRWNGIEGTAADLIDWPLREAANPHRNGFALLWESIHGDGSWAANPWVWAVKFRRLKGAA